MDRIIEIFNEIRRVPYKIVEVEYSIDNSYSLINSNGASCSPKHIVLYDKFKSLGLETMICVHEFKWSDFKIDFPKQLTDLFKYFPLDFHSNLEIKVKNNWIRVDATWDDALIDGGFPGTKIWDGKTSTLNCVPSIKEFKFDSLKSRDEFLRRRKENMKNDTKGESEFIFELNDFIEKIRIKK